MKKYIAIGVVVFLGSLFILVPASMASKLLPNNIVGQHYEGNIWQGSAASLRINNVDIGSISWTIKPLCFITFRVCAHVNQIHPRVRSSFDLKLRNNIELNQLQASGDAAMLSSLMKGYGITSTGNFTADVTMALFKNNRLQTMDGVIQFNSLVLNGVLRLSIGDVESVFLPQADHTQIDIVNSNGHVDLSGVVQLFADMSYALDMRLQQNADTDESIANGMRFIGKAQPDGSIRLQQKGQLTI